MNPLNLQWQYDTARPGCFYMALNTYEAGLRPCIGRPGQYDLTLRYPPTMGLPFGRSHVIPNISGEKALKRAREHVCSNAANKGVTEIRGASSEGTTKP